MRLLVDHLWTKIDGKYPETVIDRATSYLQEGYFFSPQYKKGHWDGRIRLADKKNSRFPTGLLAQVTEALDHVGQEYEVEDDRDLPEVKPVYELNGITLRPYQREAVDAALSQTSGVIQLATGLGKSACAAAIIKSLGRETIWITHRTQLAQQMRVRLAEALGQPVGLVGDGVEEIERVTICMVQTLDRSETEHRQPLRDFLARVEVLVGDEFHRAASKGGSDQWYRQILKTNVRWRYGLTATPDFDGAGLRLTAITGPVIYKMSVAEGIDGGYLVPPRIWYIENSDPKITATGWAAVYREGIVQNETRNRAVAEAADRLALDKKRPLILVRQIAHGNTIVEKCEARGLKVDFVKGSMSPDVRELCFTALKTGAMDALVAQVETVGEGLDFPWLRSIINAIGEKGGGNASKGEVGQQTIQVLGRGLRRDVGKEFVEYVDFLDTTHKDLKKASKDRVGTLDAEGHSERMGFWKDYKP